MAAAYSSELPEFGVKTGLANYSAAYCTGLLCARRLLTKMSLDTTYKGNAKVGKFFELEENEEKRSFKCFLDIGLCRSTTGANVFGALKGGVDGGLNIPYSGNRLAAGYFDKKSGKYNEAALADRIYGKHVSEYMKYAKEEDEEWYKSQFSQYIKNGVEADSIKSMYEKCHDAIRAKPVIVRAIPAKCLPKAERKAHREQKKSIRVERIAKRATERENTGKQTKMAEPLRVLVTGAAGQIAYSLLYSVARGDVFGKDQPIILVLLDIAPMMEVLNGVVMELTDCSLPLLQQVIPSCDEMEAFKDVDVAMLVGAMPRREGMERKDLLAANVKIFKSQGQAIDKVAKKTIKVVVVGNPANTNAYICKKYAPSIPPQNFTALTRLDQNRAQAQVAARLGVPNSAVKNCVIWGNHSSTQYPDLTYAVVNVGGKEVKAREAIKDDNWVKNDFVKTVQQRGAAVIKARKLSSAMSAAKAIVDHVHDWWFGVPEGSMVSMAVPSDGSYGIEEGLVYSFPVRTKPDHTYEIIKDLTIDDFSREKMDITMKELVDEKNMAMSACQD